SDVVVPAITEVLATAEKELDYALPFDKVKPVEHDDLKLVPADLKATLQERSTQRVKESADFAKVNKEIEKFKARKARKSIPLNEKELREQYDRDGKSPDDAPTPPSDNGVYKFKREF